MYNVEIRNVNFRSTTEAPRVGAPTLTTYYFDGPETEPGVVVMSGRTPGGNLLVKIHYPECDGYDFFMLERRNVKSGWRHAWYDDRGANPHWQFSTTGPRTTIEFL